MRIYSFVIYKKKKKKRGEIQDKLNTMKGEREKKE